MSHCKSIRNLFLPEAVVVIDPVGVCPHEIFITDRLWMRLRRLLILLRNNLRLLNLVVLRFLFDLTEFLQFLRFAWNFVEDFFLFSKFNCPLDLITLLAGLFDSFFSFPRGILLDFYFTLVAVRLLIRVDLVLVEVRSELFEVVLIGVHLQRLFDGGEAFQHAWEQFAPLFGRCKFLLEGFCKTWAIASEVLRKLAFFVFC